MLKTVARFATRATDASGKVDLILGAAWKNETVFKPDTIYEIREMMGQLTVVEVGPSAAKLEETPKSIWDCGIEAVVTCYRARWLLTLKEWKDACKKG